MAYLIFLLGAVFGSFLNVCIYRLPRELSLIRPGSHCPQCQRSLAWYENIPIVAYAALGGRCRSCRKPIGWQYPVVEALNGALWVVLYRHFGLSAVWVLYAAMASGLVVSTFIDLEFRIIPDEISLGGLLVGLVASVLVPELHHTAHRGAALLQSVIGALVGGGLLYGTGVLGNVLFRRESMGGGDVKLLAMAGSLMGWQLATLSFFLAPLLAFIPGLMILLWKKSHEIPYGPFLALAIVASLIRGQWLLEVLGVTEVARVMKTYYF
ncbi:MAG: prepilin peptidase [Candidatus Omnitrophica bacterium]|nr:prepilin peptidase [Candidatus Omnitrophota bacterium]